MNKRLGLSEAMDKIFSLGFNREDVVVEFNFSNAPNQVYEINKFNIDECFTLCREHQKNVTDVVYYVNEQYIHKFIVTVVYPDCTVDVPVDGLDTDGDYPVVRMPGTGENELCIISTEDTMRLVHAGKAIAVDSEGMAIVNLDTVADAYYATLRGTKLDNAIFELQQNKELSPEIKELVFHADVLYLRDKEEEAALIIRQIHKMIGGNTRR